MSRSRAWFQQKAGRRDANHAAIRDGLRKLGHFVVDTAAVGDGVPDLLVYPRGYSSRMQPMWLELKTEKGKLREAQLRWGIAAVSRGAARAIVRTLDEAIEALR